MAEGVPRLKQAASIETMKTAAISDSNSASDGFYIVSYSLRLLLKQMVSLSAIVILMDSFYRVLVILDGR